MPIAFPLLFLLAIVAPVSAVDLDHPFSVDLNDPAALEEATRVLAEEVKLASRPPTYLLVDLVANAVILKARGLELQRLSLSTWCAESPDVMTGTYRLVARPSVVRRKIDPSKAREQEPIALADMPTHYHLDFTPPLSIDVVPPADKAPLQWMLTQVGIWGRWLRSQFHALESDPSSPHPRLVLTLPEGLAQSLAWSLVDGMPVIVRRPHR